jgi:7-keto-8-aminopelargonate synthetase-like enzyme
MSPWPGAQMLNLCANNYLGLADDPRLIAAAKQAMDDHGFGMASGPLHLRHARPAPTT